MCMYVVLLALDPDHTLNVCLVSLCWAPVVEVCSSLSLPPAPMMMQPLAQDAGIISLRHKCKMINIHMYVAQEHHPLFVADRQLCVKGAKLLSH